MKHLKNFWGLYLAVLLIAGVLIYYFFWYKPKHDKEGTFCFFKNTDDTVSSGRILNGVCTKMESPVGATAPGGGFVHP